MGFLDNEGLSRVWENVRSALAGKQDKLSGNLGQVVGFSQGGAAEAQHLNLAHLSDGNPVGAVIGFMGLTAPAGYLICDGAEYSVGEYPALTDFFRQQFGSASHFGGDGTATFAVPDLRNLFLRGFHGEAEEQLSGEIGEKQEATVFPDYGCGGTSNPNGAIYIANPTPASGFHAQQRDTLEGLGTSYASATIATAHAIDNGGDTCNVFTSRPVNMAVLYCIKAVENAPAGNAYSAEETRIGTWIDGKPLYRKVVELTTGNTASIEYLVDLSDLNMEDLVSMTPVIQGAAYHHGAKYPASCNEFTCGILDGFMLWFRLNNDAFYHQRATIILEYTKTID